MRVPSSTAELEAQAKQIRDAANISLNADMFDRWGPKDDTAQREAIEREAADAYSRRSAAIEQLERRVPLLRTSEPEAVEAWADAHLELLAEFLARTPPDSTEQFVAARERDQWVEVRTGACSRFDQNVYYVRYDRSLYAAIFGFDY
jgi:hypothetical protein